MRKIVLLLVLLAIGTIAFSQEITVRFTGQLNGTDYCRLDRVVVTNLTRNWSETLEYPDTIIVLGGTVGANLNIAATQGLGQNIPNPFDCETRVELSVSQRENVRMQLLDASGKQYAEYSGSLDAGVHTFDISAAAPQTYVLNATVGSRSYSIRMVNMGSGCGSSIKYASVSGSIMAKLTTANEFQTGDNMRYVGYSTIAGEVVTSAAVEQPQNTSQYVTLNFTHNSRPTVVTLAATDITITSARLNGNITENNASVTAHGFQLGVSENDLSVSLPVNTTDATFSMNIPGLDANTTYYFRAYATDELGTVYGEVLGFTTSSVVAPTVNTLAVTGVTYTTATLAGSITSDGGAAVTECGFRYSTSPMFGSYETVTCSSVSNNFGYSLEGLNTGTTYYVKAYATNEVGTSLGEMQTFTTNSYLAPAVTTLAASGITVTSATLNGTVTSDGGAEITERGFVYSTSPLFGTTSTITSDSETYSFSANITELTPSTTYYYKAYATNSVGTTYGEILNFTSLAIGNPSVETYAATNVTYTSAVINGAVVSDGGATITGRGFYWGTTADNLSEQVTAGIGTSNFNASLSNLTDGTTYYYKAYATNSAGTAYGNTLSFTTHEILAPTVETRAATEITRVSAKLNGEITADGGTDVTARGFIYSQYSNFTTYETVNAATAENVFYVNIESLSPVTTYYYKAFATNSRGTTYGQAMQFTTLEFYLPTVVTNDATDVTISSATLNGNITSDGGSTITAKGFQYGTSADNLANTVSLGMGAGTLTTNISNLDDNNTYYYRAYASNTQGTAYGETKSFTTVEILAPTVVTMPVTGNTRTSLTLNASITSDGGAAVTARGFYWGTAENDLPNYVASEQTSADFSATISDLEVNTVYYYCAVATNMRGTALGEVLSARTNPISAPMVVTNEATNITLTTADLNARIADNGGTTIIACGFYWGTSVDNLVNNVVSNVTADNFSVNITGLTHSTIYYYCAYATNSTSTAIGEVMSFTTLTPPPPTVTTGTVSSITATGATLSGNVTSDGGMEVTARGFLYGTNASNLTQTVQSGNGTGSFTKALTGLSASTTYYYKAYATNAIGTSYGEVKQFTTSMTTGTLNGYAWVDLGLPSGTRWATCNVGANSPTAYGNFYAWGETRTKTTYNSSSYTIPQYNSSTTLGSTLDAATANMGTGWRMPTQTEMNELKNNCTVTWTTQNGIHGCLFTGPNGNSIFLPAAGHYEGSSNLDRGTAGYYWSSSRNSSSSDHANFLRFTSSGCNMSSYYRYYGFSVRAVCNQ